jgi:hypothetical protein
MNKLFESETNPLTSILLAAMMEDGEKLLDEENIIYLYQEIYEYLTMNITKIDDVDYLDFDIESDKEIDFIQIKAKNIVTALWFCGIFPNDNEGILDKGKYRYLGKEYSFNKRTKKLKVKTL